MDDQQDPDDAPTQWFPPVPPPVAGWQPDPADETVLLPRLEAAGPAYGTGAAEAAYGTGPVPGLADGEAAEGDRFGPGEHRQGGPARPWVLLGGILAAALLAVGGLVWMIGAAIGGDRPAPVAAPPATRSATPSPTPSPTPPEDTAPYTPPATSAPPAVTLPPRPTATRVVPTPRRTTPRPTEDPALVEVPDVVGMRVSSARRVLEQAGLNSSVLFGGGGNRQVVAQQPRGGRVARGSTVVLLTGRPRDR